MGFVYVTSMSEKSPSRRAPRLTADTADRHVLYEASVQDTSHDLTFIDRIFRKLRNRKPMRLREDFCGTAKLCADWVSSHPERESFGLDLHQPTMNWGKKHHVTPLGVRAKAVHLLKRDVREGVGEAIDVAVAFNFSYCALKTRKDMLAYFTNVRQDLGGEGVFFLDIHGGTESFEEMEESTKHKGFTYVWDQEPYDAVNGYALRHIHFRFPDGTEMHRAFSYDWRMWTLPELCDVLKDAGFVATDVYWEGTAEDGTGDGNFKKVRRAENELSFVSYIVAHRGKSE